MDWNGEQQIGDKRRGAGFLKHGKLCLSQVSKAQWMGWEVRWLQCHSVMQASFHFKSYNPWDILRQALPPSVALFSAGILAWATCSRLQCSREYSHDAKDGVKGHKRRGSGKLFIRFIRKGGCQQQQQQQQSYPTWRFSSLSGIDPKCWRIWLRNLSLKFWNQLQACEYTESWSSLRLLISSPFSI